LRLYRFFWIVFFILIGAEVTAQQPSYIRISSENGLPSNEVYSILQDNNGMIWIGCDAGLFKYDGVRFINYKNANQQSKSLSGLSLSASGRIYVHSFKGQIFYVENDSLHELPNPNGRVPSLVCDKKFNIWVSHQNGISVFNEKSNKWKVYTEFKSTSSFKPFPNGLVVDSDDKVWFYHGNNLCNISDGKFNCYGFEESEEKIDFLNMFLHRRNAGVWIVNRISGELFYMENGVVKPHPSDVLRNALKGRKVTGIKELEENKIWFFTYSGALLYDATSDKLEIICPQFSFSGMIKDREGMHWFSTVQNGIIKIPTLDFKVWNSDNNLLNQDAVYKIISDENFIYFSTVNGFIGNINVSTNQIQVKNSPISGDIQQIYYDSLDKKLYFTLNNSLYFIDENNRDGQIENVFQPIKQMLHTDDGYFIATSFGAFHYKSLNDDYKHIVPGQWTRSISYDKKRNTIWMASNNGLLKISKRNNIWSETNSFYKNTLIVYATLDSISNVVYSVDFKGRINALFQDESSSQIAQIPDHIQPYQIHFKNNKLYVATNRGLWIYDLKLNLFQVLNKQTGLASDNVQGIAFNDSFIWLATGKGVQKIPINFVLNDIKGIVYLKKLMVGNYTVATTTNLKVNHDQSISFQLEASNYISNGKFNYAYRLNNSKNKWIEFPADIEQIDIPKLPIGKFIIEIKLIDYLGNDSENIIEINGVVKPPFWQMWWFFVLVILIISFIVIILIKSAISSLEKKQQKEIEKLTLEHQLRLTQQAALKAQMNPHFLFNVLNSIKGYIYENDKKNAALYLNDFSDLVRKVLELSTLPKVKLEEEINVVELYIKLEAMLLQQSFYYTIDVDKSLDSSAIYMPALIIQPFIENSFKHGLRHKQGDKHLGLHISLEGISTLKVEIVDNGIGRKASAEINSKQEKNHTSFATSAIENRIALLNHEKSGIIGIEIIDLLDGVKPLGTKVILRINIDEQ
jgi:ligand-binding sensor domain-containing protein